jgi:hypothetical protein
MLTEWSAVKGSELITGFDDAPGTIWGFENLRQPYVQAAHETTEGAQPLRMLELWEAVGQATQNPEVYMQLIENPTDTANDLVEKGVGRIRSELFMGNPKYEDIKDQDAYIERFREDAKAMLLEFAAQMPKGTLARTIRDDAGKRRTVSELVGINHEAYMGGIACKAGLWWAKQKEKPVYYCLDGVNMDEATDYKKVKNKAIEQFIASGGRPANAQAHQEVITLVEVREILKNWDELRGTVKFVHKGRILKDGDQEILNGQDLETAVAGWRRKMDTSNKEAGRAPAPPKSTFANELKAIDPGLMASIPDDAEGDKDARDIVRKSGYLVKIAKARPEIVLKYIMSKCRVLVHYKLIPEELPKTAARLGTAGQGEIADASARLLREIEACKAIFKAPLEAALIRHPLIAQGRTI